MTKEVFPITAHPYYVLYIVLYMFHAMLEFTQFADIVTQWVAVADPDYYTELADHSCSSSDQLTIVHIYVLVKATVNCIVNVLGYNFQHLWPYHDSGCFGVSQLFSLLCLTWAPPPLSTSFNKFNTSSPLARENVLLLAVAICSVYAVAYLCAQNSLESFRCCSSALVLMVANTKTSLELTARAQSKFMYVQFPDCMDCVCNMGILRLR